MCSGVQANSLCAGLLSALGDSKVGFQGLGRGCCNPQYKEEHLYSSKDMSRVQLVDEKAAPASHLNLASSDTAHTITTAYGLQPLRHRSLT